MKNDFSNLDYICLGDDDNIKTQYVGQYSYLNDCFCNGENYNWQKMPVIVFFHPTVTIELKDDYWYVGSPQMLKGQKLLICPKHYDIKELLANNPRISLIYFEAYPFKKLSTQVCPNTNLMVLVNLTVRHRAFTDLDSNDGDSELVAASNYYWREYHIPSLIVNEKADFAEILALPNRKLRIYQRNIFTQCSEISPFLLQWLYKDEVKEPTLAALFPTDSLNSITSYEKIKDTEEYSLWDAYMEATEKVLFPSNLLESVLDLRALYENEMVFSKEMLLWNIDKDIEGLLLKIRTAFRASLRKAFVEGNIVRPFTDETYKRMRSGEASATKGIHIKYRQRLEDFLENEAYQIVEEHINSQYNKLKRCME